GARADRHDVQMAGEAKRRLRVRSTRARDHAGAGVRILVIVDTVAPLLEQAAGIARAVALAAGRVDGVELKQRPGKANWVGCGVGPAHAANHKTFVAR